MTAPFVNLTYHTDLGEVPTFTPAARRHAEKVIDARLDDYQFSRGPTLRTVERWEAWKNVVLPLDHHLTRLHEILSSPGTDSDLLTQARAYLEAIKETS